MYSDKNNEFLLLIHLPCPYRDLPYFSAGYLNSMTSFSILLLEILICFSCWLDPLETLLTADEHLSQSNSSLIVNCLSLVCTFPRVLIKIYCSTTTSC